MDYIYQFQNHNIEFNIISKKEAIDIMCNEFTFHKLLSYTSLFEKYNSGEKSGLFVSLDFGQLYYLAEIDLKLSQILMCMCLEIDEKLKTKLVFDAERICDTNSLMMEYYNSDREYLERAYVSDKNDAVNYSLGSKTEMSFVDFLSVVQFGTLERMIHFFYKKYAFNMYSINVMPFETHLSSVRRIRNIVAHNNSILNKLGIKTDYLDLKMRSFLGKQGIKNRTLQTNMSRLIISDLCGLFDVYFNLVGNKNSLEMLNSFNAEYIQKYKKYFTNNDILKSSYKFLEKVIVIYYKKFF